MDQALKQNVVFTRSVETTSGVTTNTNQPSAASVAVVVVPAGLCKTTFKLSPAITSGSGQNSRIVGTAAIDRTRQVKFRMCTARRA